MPHRRRVHKGSFGSHFDELVKHFRNHQNKAGNGVAKPPDDAEKPSNIHDRLFETAWHKGRGH